MLNEYIKRIKNKLYWPWFWKKYTEEDWNNERAPEVMLSDPIDKVLYNPIGSTFPCPKCKKVGFYGAKEVDDRKYRACKFCGFWQEVWGNLQSGRSRYGKPYRSIHFYCDRCKTIDTYNWTMPGTKDFDYCKKCGGKNKRTKWAIDNRNHPYRRLKPDRIVN